MLKTTFSVVLLFLFMSVYSQTNYNFSTPATLSGSPWKSTATITIGGVVYTISGGINGGYTNVTTGGNGNSAALKKDGSGGDNVTIKRQDGKKFQFYGLWLKQLSYSPYPNTPPYYTIRFWNGSTEIKNYAVNEKSTTKIYTENIAVTHVSVMFNALDNYTLDDLKVGPAIPSADANLSNIKLNKGSLSPVFSSGTTSYTASVDYNTTTLNITPISSDPDATIKVNGSNVNSNSALGVSLNIGNNTITIDVTAENGSVKKKYTLTVNRSATLSYCTPSSNASEGDNIHSLALQGEQETSIADNNTGGAGGGYVYRSSVPSIKLTQGSNYNGSLTTQGINYTGSDGEHIKLWIDFNDNYIFETNELVYNSPGLITSSSSLNFKLPIPVTAPAGTHRMRIRAVYEESYNQTNFTACSDEQYGETHDYNIQVLAMAPLPLTLLSFEAVQFEKQVTLHWTTAGERNVARYKVETSADGISFSPGANVPAKNNSSDLSYSWTDEQPLNGDRFYRLKMIDNDGQFTSSKILRLSNVQKELASVYPNPVRNLFTLSVSSGLLNTEAVLLDSKGTVVQKIRITNQQQQVNTSTLSAGIYVLKLANGQSIKVLKK